MSKLTALHINIIGIVSALVLAGILYFVLIKPRTEEVTSTQGQVATTEQAGGTDTAVKQKERELKDAKVTAAKNEADWRVSQARYMPDFNLKGDTLSLYVNNFYGRYGFKDLPRLWGQWITAWYDAQEKNGIKVKRLPGTEFPISAFPAEPNQIANVKHLNFPGPNPADVWPVQVEAKTFDDAMRHLAQFNRMTRHGMPVINNVALTGHSPNLIMNYDLAIYIIQTDPTPPADPRISPAAAAGAAGAPGGFPGAGAMGGGMGGPPVGGSMGTMGGGRRGGGKAGE